MTDPNAELTAVIESICELGCTEVKACIEALQSGKERSEYIHLDTSGRRQLHRELQDIMSIYDSRQCS